VVGAFHSTHTDPSRPRRRRGQLGYVFWVTFGGKRKQTWPKKDLETVNRHLGISKPPSRKALPSKVCVGILYKPY